MARQRGGDLYDFDNLSDDEIRQVVLDHLRQEPTLDAGWIDVEVRDGFVTLTGRVGTDGEYQVAESLIDDVLGIDDFSNELVVGELYRGEAPAGADARLARDEEIEEPLGEPNDQHSDTAEHLAENLDAEMFGTQDPSAAVRDGTSYEPPEGPIPEGYTSREDH